MVEVHPEANFGEPLDHSVKPTRYRFVQLEQGDLGLNMMVEGSLITKVAVYGTALDEKIGHKLEGQLTGTRVSLPDLQDKLSKRWLKKAIGEDGIAALAQELSIENQ